MGPELTGEKIGTGRACVRQRPGMAQAWPGNRLGRHLSMSSWEVKMVRHPLAGYLVWAVMFAALFAWKGLSLARAGSLRTRSGVFRVIMRYPVGRWVLFALWLWAGWQLFIRRWLFLPGPETENVPCRLGPLTVLCPDLDAVDGNSRTRPGTNLAHDPAAMLECPPRGDVETREC
jgi:hypothetical protein